jgi:hypothetical protein
MATLLRAALPAAIGVALCAATTTAQTPPTAASRLRLVVEDPQLRLTAAQLPAAAPPSPATGTTPAGPAFSPPSPAAATAPRRSADPTVPDASIRDLLGDTRPEAPRAAAFPEIRLRARIVASDRPATALIEIGGPAMREPPPPAVPGQGYATARAVSTGVFRTIREGDEFVIPGETPTPIRVAKLTGSEVLLEVVNKNALIRLD